MQKSRMALAMLAVIPLVFGGCVSKSEYMKTVDAANALEVDNGRLKTELGAAGKRNEQLTADRAELERLLAARSGELGRSIAELRDRLDFREDLAVLGETAEVGVRPEELSRWAESTNRLTQRWILPAAVLLPVLLIAAVISWNVTGLASPVVAVLLLELGVVRLLGKRLVEVLGGAEQAFDKLRLLADLTTRLEREPLEAPLAKELLQRLSSSGVPASRAAIRPSERIRG